MRELIGRGVAFQEYETPKTVDFIAQIGPARGAWFADPDGNIFGLRQGPPIGPGVIGIAANPYRSGGARAIVVRSLTSPGNARTV